MLRPSPQQASKSSETGFPNGGPIVIKLKWFEGNNLGRFPTSIEVKTLKLAFEAMEDEKLNVVLVHNNMSVQDVDTLVQQWEAAKARLAAETAARALIARREARKWPSLYECTQSEKERMEAAIKSYWEEKKTLDDDIEVYEKKKAELDLELEVMVQEKAQLDEQRENLRKIYPEACGDL